MSRYPSAWPGRVVLIVLALVVAGSCAVEKALPEASPARIVDDAPVTWPEGWGEASVRCVEMSGCRYVVASSGGTSQSGRSIAIVHAANCPNRHAAANP